MGARAYVLLDVEAGKSEQVAQALRGKSSVVMADPLEGTPDVIVIVEAPDRKRLAELTIEVLAEVESMTEGLQLLPAQDDRVTIPCLKPSRRGKK